MNLKLFLIVICDFNCEYSVSSRFHDSFTRLMSDNQLMCSDVRRLMDAFSYCSDNGMHVSWTDHVLCSKILNDRIVDVGVHYDYQSSDHKPHATATTEQRKTEKLKTKKTDMLRSVGVRSVESVESVLNKKKEGYSGKDLQKRKVLSLE